MSGKLNDPGDLGCLGWMMLFAIALHACNGCTDRMMIRHQNARIKSLEQIHAEPLKRSKTFDRKQEEE